jgi:hypothetical protein
MASGMRGFLPVLIAPTASAAPCDLAPFRLETFTDHAPAPARALRLSVFRPTGHAGHTG